MSKKINFLIAPLLVFCLVSFPASSAQGFSVGEEKEVGEKLLYTIRSSFDVFDSPDIHQYLAKLGDEVLDVAGVQYFDYHFFLIKNKEFNAFAAPSGLIFFHSGLVEQMNGENELVSVLAHEIGHVAKRHIASRIDKGKKISIATMGLILASLALGGGEGTEALFAGSIAAGQSANLHFSRKDEEEADLLAYGWMKKMGRHPHGQEKMLKTMRQIARYRSTKLPQYLLTHPNPEARLDYVQTLIESDSEDLKSHTTGDDFDFLRFKYRIMSQTKESLYFRSFLSSVLTNTRSSELNKTMAKYGLALLESSENNYKKSLNLLQEVIDTHKDKTILLVDKGIVEIEAGLLNEAYSTLTQAYNNNRKDMYAAFWLAKVSLSLGKISKAEDLFSDVIYGVKDFSKAYFEMGRLSAKQKKKSSTKYYLGKYYLLEGKVKVAQKNFEEAIKDDELSQELKSDAEESIELIKRLEKKS